MDVLICDDAIYMRMVLRKILEENGYKVVGEASTGIEAIDKYNELLPDIVTMDINMPDMDGVCATKEIMKAHPGAKIIIVSALGEHPRIIEAIDQGAVNFIVKPFKVSLVVGVLKKISKKI